jgi:hypothetical protein
MKMIAPPDNVQDRFPVPSHAAVTPLSQPTADLAIQPIAFPGVHGDVARERVQQADVVLGGVTDLGAARFE